MALYNQYRPKTFQEVIGQQHIVTVLENQVSEGRIHHTHLFYGPRGTGKTTLARILAKAANCLGEKKPCQTCSICLSFDSGRFMDLVEIDGASNRGIDNVRSLITRTHFQPTEGQYKVYIIDECHQLTDAASQALLKTLEEPPLQVIFCLATTRPDLMLDTILSRCIKHGTRLVAARQIVNLLSQTAQSEEMEIEDAAIEFIAEMAQGSVRDALSILEVAMSYGIGKVKDIQEVIFGVDAEVVDAIESAIDNLNPFSVVGMIKDRDLGQNTIYAVMNRYHARMLSGVLSTQSINDLAFILKNIREVVKSFDEGDPVAPKVSLISGLGAITERVAAVGDF